jgi:hypothetical protein
MGAFLEFDSKGVFLMSVMNGKPCGCNDVEVLAIAVCDGRHTPAT